MRWRLLLMGLVRDLSTNTSYLYRHRERNVAQQNVNHFWASQLMISVSILVCQKEFGKFGERFGFCNIKIQTVPSLIEFGT